MQHRDKKFDFFEKSDFWRLGASPARSETQPVRRSLLFCFGGKAEQVGQMVIDMAHKILPAKPLIGLYSWQMGENRGRQPSSELTEKPRPQPTAPMLDQAPLLELCEELCGAEQIELLQQQGYVLHRPEELQVWLLIDLNDEQTGKQADAVLATLDKMQEAVWQRLRIHTIFRALLLSHPKEQRRMTDWAVRLAPCCDGPLYLAGPINWEYVCLDEQRWMLRCTTALFGLLWGAAPANSRLDEFSRGEQWALSIGAAAWFAARSELQRLLANEWIGWLCKFLYRSDLPVGYGYRGEPSARQAIEELRSSVPPPPGASIWGKRRPGLFTLQALPGDLRRREQQRNQRLSPEQRRARQIWLGHQVELLEADLASLRTAMFAPADQPPNLSGWRRQIDALFESTARELEVISQALDTLSEAEEQAKQKVEQAYAELEALLADLPTASLTDFLRRAMQPWQWLRWFWRYWQELPEQAQRVLSAQDNERRQNWSALNHHTVRQLYLARMQSLRQAGDELAQIEKRIQALAAAAGREPHALPAPWAEQTLAALWVMLYGSGEEVGREFLKETPLSSWLEMDEIEIEERIYRHVALRITQLEKWSAGELLTAALPPAERAIWLEQQLRMAMPLWPAQELSLEQPMECWILEPVPTNRDEGSALWSATLDFKEALWTRSYFDGVLILRLAPVDLSIEEGGS